MAPANQNTSLDMQVLVTCALVLYGKFLVATLQQSRPSFDADTRMPEDTILPLAKGKPSQSFIIRLDHPDEVIRAVIHNELRWKRIVQNDIEAIPLALTLFLISISVKAKQSVTVAALVTFTCMRIVHTLAYANKKARVLAWAIGVACILTGGVHGIVAVVR